jgi:GR25 family glycosyltransferase involved in LPS biosynthesis
MKLEDVFPLMYYINLSERIDKRKLAEEEFVKLGISPKRFIAIRHEFPAFGCLKSHISILQEARSQQKSVLIFEDDVQFVGDYKNTIEKALDELMNIDFNMFYLGGNVLKDVIQVTDHLGKLQHCQSTHAYGVTAKFLDVLVPFLEKNQYILDVLYADHVIPYSNCYITVPMAAIQRTQYSDIEHQVMSYDIPIARFNQHLIRKGGL